MSAKFPFFFFVALAAFKAVPLTATSASLLFLFKGGSALGECRLQGGPADGNVGEFSLSCYGPTSASFSFPLLFRLPAVMAVQLAATPANFVSFVPPVRFLPFSFALSPSSVTAFQAASSARSPLVFSLPPLWRFQLFRLRCNSEFPLSFPCRLRQRFL